jgi:hypothetical protein
MSIPAYDIGDKLRLGNHLGVNEDGTDRGAFTDITGTAANPTTVRLELRRPDGTELVYNWPTQGSGTGLLTQEGPGRFYRDVSLDGSGLWCWILSGTGAVETSEQGGLYARRSVFA